MVYAGIMAQEGFTAATKNFTAPDAHTAHLNMLTTRREEPPRLMLCNAAGFGGSNAALVVDFHG